MTFLPESCKEFETRLDSVKTQEKMFGDWALFTLNKIYTRKIRHNYLHSDQHNN